MSDSANVSKFDQVISNLCHYFLIIGYHTLRDWNSFIFIIFYCFSCHFKFYGGNVESYLFSNWARKDRGFPWDYYGNADKNIINACSVAVKFETGYEHRRLYSVWIH